jgi:hypothetical protein
MSVLMGMNGSVKFIFVTLTACLLLAGCTTSTVETRRAERMAAYNALPQETRDLVDRSEIKVGMTEDAVYIAWGAPSQITRGENKDGETTTWLYRGTALQDRTFWNSRVTYNRQRAYTEYYLDHEYYPQNYLRAQVTFSKGAVVDWQMLPHPY